MGTPSEPVWCVTRFAPINSLAAAPGLVRRRDELDATRLTSTTRVDLRLDDDGAAQVGRRSGSLFGSLRDHAFRDGYTALIEYLFPAWYS